MANNSLKTLSSAILTSGGAFSPAPSGRFPASSGNELLPTPGYIFSYWLIWRLAGPNPAAYHFFQWILYMATGLVVFRIGREIVGNQSGGLHRFAALALAPVAR